MEQISEHTDTLLDSYFSQLGRSDEPTNLYEIVMGDAEAGLLDATMHFVRGNQSEAARLLHMNRATIKRKLIRHNLY